MYSDQEPSKVALLAGKVAAVFAKGKRFADSAELEELKQLKAEAQASVFSSLSVRLVSERVSYGIPHRAQQFFHGGPLSPSLPKLDRSGRLLPHEHQPLAQTSK